MQRRLGLTEEAARRITQAFDDASRAQRAFAESARAVQYPGGPGASGGPPASLPGMAAGIGGPSGYQAQGGAGGAYPGASVQPTSIQAFQAANQALATSAATAQTAVTGLGAGLQQYQTQAGQAVGPVNQLSGSFSALQAVLQAGGGFGRGLGMGGGVVGYILGGLAARGIVETAEAVGHLTASVVENGEAWTVAEQRIQFALQTTREQAGQIRQQLADQTKGVPLETSVNTFQRIANPLQQAGFGVEQIESVTRSLNELAVVSGTTPDRAKRAIYEISEAFSVGKLHGQQFRTAILDMPAILIALEQATGKSQAKILEMGHAGELTGNMLASSLLKYLPQLDQQFGSVGNTVSRAAADVGTAWTEVAGKASEQTGLVTNLASAYEGFADFLRSPAFMGVLKQVAGLVSDLSKGIADSERQINAFNASLSKAATGDPGTIEGRVGAASAARAQAERLREQARAAASAGGGQETPAQLADRFSSLADRQAAPAPAAAGQQGAIQSLEEQAAAADKAARSWTALAVAQGQAQAFSADAVPPALTEEQKLAADINRDLDARTGKAKTLQDLQERYVKLVDMENDARQTGEGGAKRLAAIEEAAAAAGKAVATERSREQTQQLAASRNITEQEAARRLSQSQQPDAGLTGAAQAKARIDELKDTQRFLLANDAPQQQVLTVTRQISQEEQRLAEIRQRGRDTLQQQHDQLVKNADAEHQLAASLDQVEKGRRTQPGQAGPALGTRQDVDLAQTAAFRSYYQRVEGDATKAAAGASELERIEAQIAAVQEAQGRHVRDQGVGAAELLRLEGERSRVAARVSEQIEGQVQSDQASIEKQRLALQRAQSGGGGIEERIRAAGEAAADRYKLLTPEQAAVDPGADIRIRAIREEAQANGELQEKEAVQKEALQALGIPQLQFTEQLHRLQEQLRAGFITWDQYTGAVNRARQAMVQAAVQQHVQDLYAKGDPFSSKAGIVEQLEAGAQAAGLNWIERYGNAARDAGEAATAMGEAGVDAFAAWATGAQVSLPQIEQQLAQLVIKETMAFLISRALMAAFNLTPGGGVPAAWGGGAGLPAFGAGSTVGGGLPGMDVYHGGTRDVGSGGGIRVVEDPTVFLYAPRHHSGYNAFAADERPAVLRTGETVLDRQESRAYASGAQAPRVSLVINNHAGVQVRTSQRAEADGTVSLEAQLTSHQNNALVGGKSDKAMGQRFGLAKRLI